MKLITCTCEKHAQPILAILNEAIANSTAIYDDKPRPAESMVSWFQAKQAGRWLDLAYYQLILDTPAQPVDG